jgi:sortase A
MVVGGLVLLFHVGWDVWGTSFATARAQRVLKVQLSTSGFPDHPVPRGAAGVIRIPRFSLDMAFVEGVDPVALAKGPGHYPNTPYPGRGGNVAIAGHRTTHLAPFWSLDALKRGDRISLQTRAGTFVYAVVWSKVVGASARWVLAPTPRPSLTLTTCYPRFSSKQRLVIRAVQVEDFPASGVATKAPGTT